jgi:hypothetical protein
MWSPNGVDEERKGGEQMVSRNDCFAFEEVSDIHQ